MGRLLDLFVNFYQLFLLLWYLVLELIATRLRLFFMELRYMKVGHYFFNFLHVSIFRLKIQILAFIIFITDFHRVQERVGQGSLTLLLVCFKDLHLFFHEFDEVFTKVTDVFVTLLSDLELKVSDEVKLLICSYLILQEHELLDKFLLDLSLIFKEYIAIHAKRSIFEAFYEFEVHQGWSGLLKPSWSFHIFDF